MDYKRELDELFGIRFNALHIFNNQPIKRFAAFLYRRGELGDYMNLLVANFNPHAVDGLMCTNTINVGWSGFNQQIQLPPQWQIEELRPFSINENVRCDHSGPTVFDLDHLDQFKGAQIATDSHCFACTAGAGSKCGT